MDDTRVGSVLLLLRKRKAWRQADVARVSGVSRATISRLERGQFESVSIGSLRRVAKALSMRIDLTPLWHAGELDRLLDAGHAALVAAVVERLRDAHGWLVQPEVSFSIWGERGSIDILAFHPITGVLLVIEVKTKLTDLQATLSTFDRKRRLAVQIAQERGWKAASVSSWLVMADTHTNRRRVAANAVVLRSALPADGRTMHRWLTGPSGSIHAMSFVSPDR
jgi:transcriptional regulator with XRE-family HTH domain